MNSLALVLSLAQVFFVDDSAVGANDGTSWQDAFTDLQSALAVSTQFDSVWVARGVYKPTSTLDRFASFDAVCNVYGGFAGTETSFDDRAGLFDETILSGDLAGDDGPEFAGTSENSATIVTIDDFYIGHRVFDGFTVRGGRADLPNWPHRAGGFLMGYFVDRITIRNCTFERNFAGYGGAINNPGKSRLRVERCRFVGNRARLVGGGIYGGHFTDVLGCVFLGNSAGSYGGGTALPTLAVDCVFSGNTAGIEGGGSYFSGRLVNCTFSGNEAPVGGGIGGGHPCCDLPITSCILWGNRGTSGSTQDRQAFGFFRFDDCVVEGWTGRSHGQGTFDADPLFRDALGPDGIAGTIDDDLQLESGSPCIDTAPGGNYPGDGIDAAGMPRFVDSLSCDAGGILDRGALERSQIDGTSVYCTSTPSSLGVPAEIGGPCVVSLSTDGVTRITAAPVPARSAVLLRGTPESPQPFGDGFLCLAGPLRRIDSGAWRNGVVAFDVDAWNEAPGTSLGLQIQFRDPNAGGSGFNLSSAMRLVVLP